MCPRWFDLCVRRYSEMTMERGPNGQNGHFSNFVDEKLFRILLHLEVQKAVRLQYCVSVVCFTPDLQTVDPELAERIAESAVRHLRGTDVATTLSQSSIGLLLIDANLQALQPILNRATEAAQVAAQALTAQQRPVSLSAGASSYPETATSGRDLLRQASDLMSRARAEGGDRLYLPS